MFPKIFCKWFSREQQAQMHLFEIYARLPGFVYYIFYKRRVAG